MILVIEYQSYDLRKHIEGDKKIMKIPVKPRKRFKASSYLFKIQKVNKKDKSIILSSSIGLVHAGTGVYQTIEVTEEHKTLSTDMFDCGTVFSFWIEE